MAEHEPLIVNVNDAEECGESAGQWGGYWRVLTPGLPRVGHVGVNFSRVPPGQSACPFHYHMVDDEVFYVLRGRGVLRYGDSLTEIGPGDCVTCPAGAKVAHQIANPFDEDLEYLAIGGDDPNEVCGYPDSGKVMVRALKTVGRLERRDYMDGEPDRPKVFDLIAAGG